MKNFILTEPLVSIVLPTYNGARYIEQSIESCLSQTYSNWELIIVDDASTDNTLDLIARYVNVDERVRSVRHETNRKLPGALNTGFAQAKGNYLTWTSDDNCYRPQALAEMVTFLESEAEVDVVYTDYSVIDETGNPVRSVVVATAEELVKRNCIGPCFLYRRAVQEKVGHYANDLFLAEDYDFWLRASVHFRLKALHKDLYLYRRHGSSLTSLKSERIRSATFDALQRSLPQMDWLSQPLKATGCLSLAETAHLNRNKKMTLRYVAGAIRHYPPTIFRQWTIALLANALLGYRTVRFMRSVYESSSSSF